MERIVDVLMERDGLTLDEAWEQVRDAKKELHERIAEGEDCFDFCEEYFGLEPDYLQELLGLPLP